jgi:hypothetical protein
MDTPAQDLRGLTDAPLLRPTPPGARRLVLRAARSQSTTNHSAGALLATAELED